MAEIDARRTHDLRNDDAFGTVNDKGTALRHDREIAHEDFLLLDLLRLFVAQTDADLQRARVGGVTGFALRFGVLRLVVHGVVDEAQFQIAGIVRNGIHILEDFLQAGIQEPLVRALLNLQQVRHVHDLRCTGKTLAQRFPVENISWHWRTLLILERRGELLEKPLPALILLADHAILFLGCGRRVFCPTHNEQGIIAFCPCFCQVFFMNSAGVLRSRFFFLLRYLWI